MKCYYCGCNNDGKVEHQGGWLCLTHYEMIFKKLKEMMDGGDVLAGKGEIFQ